MKWINWLSKTENFIYLGGAVISTNSSDLEVERRIQAATKSFGSLRKRLWSRRDIKRITRVKVYNAAVLPALLYSTECMILYQRHIKILTRTHLGHLRQTLGIHWQDRVPDVWSVENSQYTQRRSTHQGIPVTLGWTCPTHVWLQNTQSVLVWRAHWRKEEAGRTEASLQRCAEETHEDHSTDTWEQTANRSNWGASVTRTTEVEKRSVWRNTKAPMKEDTLNNNRERMQYLWTALPPTCRLAARMHGVKHLCITIIIDFDAEEDPFALKMFLQNANRFILMADSTRVAHSIRLQHLH